MIYSIYHNKDTYEDPKTSSIFETMLMLPDDLFWNILRAACFDNDNLPKVAGLIEDYDFWPHWDPTGTTNNKLVEPDVFIRFQLFDVIIEAKYNDRAGQYSQQWENEIISYKNEYGEDKPVYFIAVGGNSDKATESIATIYGIAINKCTWLSLLIQITKFREENHNLSFTYTSHSSLMRLIDLIELAFNVHNVYNIRWFDELAILKPLISADSITTLKTYFQ